MPYPLHTENANIFLMISSGLVTLPYSVEGNKIIVTPPGNDERILDEILNTMRFWKNSLRASDLNLSNIEYVQIKSPNGKDLCQAIDIQDDDDQGVMNNSIARATKFDLLKQLSTITLETDERFAIIHMETDEAIWASSSEPPYEGLKYSTWQKNNHKGHIQEELIRYKNQLYQFGKPKLDVAHLDFTRPDISSFTYKAIALVDYSKIECCVDAWIGLYQGDLVRITRHIRPPLPI